jgi:hypothetical protein
MISAPAFMEYGITSMVCGVLMMILPILRLDGLGPKSYTLTPGSTTDNHDHIQWWMIAMGCVMTIQGAYYYGFIVTPTLLIN